MKKSILPLLLITSISASAQRLPDTVKLTLSQKQVLKLDSAINIVGNMLDSKSATKFLQDAVSPLWEQVRKQLIIDKPKEQKK